MTQNRLPARAHKTTIFIPRSWQDKGNLMFFPQRENLILVQPNNPSVILYKIFRAKGCLPNPSLMP